MGSHQRPFGRLFGRHFGRLQGRAKPIVVGGGTLALTLLWATPALAHARFVNTPGQIALNADVALMISAEHEQGDGVWNVRVAIQVPTGWSAVSCETKATWTCAKTVDGGHDVITFTKATSAQPAEDESFRFVLHTGGTAGTASVPVVQSYSNGTEALWVGPPGSAEPAPQLTIGSATPTSTTSTTSHGVPTTATTAVPPPTPTSGGQPQQTTSTTRPGAAVTTTGPTVPGATNAPTTMDPSTTSSSSPGTSVPGSSEVSQVDLRGAPARDPEEGAAARPGTTTVGGEVVITDTGSPTGGSDSNTGAIVAGGLGAVALLGTAGLLLSRRIRSHDGAPIADHELLAQDGPEGGTGDGSTGGSGAPPVLDP